MAIAPPAQLDQLGMGQPVPASMASTRADRAVSHVAKIPSGTDKIAHARLTFTPSMEFVKPARSIMSGVESAASALWVST